MSQKYQEGDIFLIPTADGRFAVCQIVCALKGRFKKAFAFGVLSIQADKSIPQHDEFLKFKNSRGMTNVIFAAVDSLKSGEWEIIGNIPLTEWKKELQIFHSAGHLYNGDEYVRMLDKSEYKQFNVMGVAGNELVQQYLAQH